MPLHIARTFSPSTRTATSDKGAVKGPDGKNTERGRGSVDRERSEFGIAFLAREANRNGATRPVLPDGLAMPRFEERLLRLTLQGEPRALELLEHLQASPFPRDQGVFDRVRKAEKERSGIIKRLLGDPCVK
ncbi:hypothetical protein [Hyalangium rubrum]|uniref:Uncharacterized protein n=1 Tax=Hyalangium rubrum TaxID=3103134 RepID=A0ABU5H886_9BACT|nr:hypothetical protein [Hyalangium sp. s54d21]MDY7229357.1 hypothetical protein [Hyalangium sp. s54d21]